MAGSWGDDGSRPDLWASLHTVMNAQFEELDPHLERFDLDDLVRFRRNLQQSIELQFERQFAEQEAREAAATSTPASSEPAAVASSSGSQDVPARAPDQQTQQVAAETTQDAAAKPAGAPAAKAPTTGPPPTMGKPKNMSQQAKAFVKADPPPFVPALSKKGKGKGKDGGSLAAPPKATTAPATSPPEPARHVAVSATPDQVRALFAGELQPQTAEDASGPRRATDDDPPLPDLPAEQA